VIQLSKTILKQIWSFVCNQYLILFFIVTIGLKLAFFNTFIIKVTWPTKKETYNYTLLVIGLSVGVALFLGAWDLIFKYGFEFLIAK